MDRVTVTLQDGEILLHGLMKNGAAIAADCGGKLACVTCRVVVESGREGLSAQSDDELDVLERAGMADEGARLACQATGRGEVTVRLAELPAPVQRSSAPIFLSPEAAGFLAKQLTRQHGCVGIRLRVAPAGCSGLRYRVDPVAVMDEHDQVFDCSGVPVAVDAESLPFLRGTTVRLAREGLDQRLRFDNPNARQSCGCGESFGV